MAFQKGVTPWNKGKTMTEEHCQQLSMSHKGQKPWNKGIKGFKHTEEAKAKIAEAGKKRKGMPLLKNRGENNPNWRGGVTNSDRLERVKFFNTVRLRVLERDDYTCQLCGIRGVELQVDHIQSWSDYIELRFKMENCRTVCKSCHYQITFGRPIPDNSIAWGKNLGRRVSE